MKKSNKRIIYYTQSIDKKKETFTLFDILEVSLTPYIEANEVMKLICGYVDITTIAHTTNAENRSNLQKACQYILFHPEDNEWNVFHYIGVMKHLNTLPNESFFEHLKYVYDVTDTYDYDRIIVSFLRQRYPVR